VNEKAALWGGFFVGVFPVMRLVLAFSSVTKTVSEYSGKFLRRSSLTFAASTTFVCDVGVFPAFGTPCVGLLAGPLLAGFFE
jgi:hypothetical protein